MRFPSRTKRAIGTCGLLLAATVLAGGVLLGACTDRTDRADLGGGDAEEGFSGATVTPPIDVSAVSLPDVSPAGGGAPFEMRARPGGVLLVYFGFTSCPDVCPTTLGDLKSALDELGEDAGGVDVAMATIDPARDTTENFNAYLGHFFDEWHALRTEDPQALAGAEAAFGVTAERVQSSGSFYAFNHTATVFAVDPEGRIVLQWPYGTEPEDVASDLGQLIAGAGDTNPGGTA